MPRSSVSPGPIANQLFESGFRLAVIGGLSVVVALHWMGALSLLEPVTVVLVALLFPIYLVFVSMLLAVWLGYDRDETNLQRVDSEEADDPWEGWPW
ncbi:hypothetical protein [Natronobacterium gregoryi]|uniref:Uncharacterized protein n=2 Tax=Natronobacterium gregoryi TaxID=44930 RepID=L0ALI6_NATGS|nr:hypothetical protein [Natronobacterium gregoryi]AFZ74052.1 hypothetical protein Natgr_2914 [Natronobacterium gregoryi SP2]ELY70353.1 hypothetical protein C490_06594 [Natronobacterium gregoryi SP2]PLK20794.1 hypothetical protein CYV19_07750 [Natronobacterium gregoryi SP2]SFJ06731.1 hypothetical protein SAMN05443661_11328 [Natronobacterium gregoryi]